MDWQNLRSFIIPGVLWVYLLSAVFARKFWGGIYGSGMARLDLTPNQGWFLPVGINFLAVVLGVFHAWGYVRSKRARGSLPILRHVSFSLGIAASTLCASGAVMEIILTRRALVAGIAESKPSKTETLFAAGRVSQGGYTNQILGMSLDLPAGWLPISLNAIYRAKDAGDRTAHSNDSKGLSPGKTSRPGVNNLLALRKFEESHSGYNPSLAVIAYEKSWVRFQGFPTLQEYAFSFASLKPPYVPKSGPSVESLADRIAYHVHIEGQFAAGTVQQHVHVLEAGDYYIVMVASVMDEADLPVLVKTISSLKLSK